jgi:signal peptidase I
VENIALGEYRMPPVVDEPSNLKLSLAMALLRSTGEAKLSVAGGSMLPTLRPGDILEIQRVADKDLSLGDIVVFARGNRLVVHRVMEMKREKNEVTVITRGDRSPKADAPISSGEVLGKVKVIQRGTRNVIPRVTRWTRAASWILLRSEFCTRVVYHLALARGKSISEKSLAKESVLPHSVTPQKAWAN